MKVRTSLVGVVLALVAFGALIISSAGSAKSEQDDFTMAIGNALVCLAFGALMY